ncbi:hypothetical protein SAMD00019534_034140, partial [Acytostelium subglobosum LB1]|uniref:hypothetical protein n=1 Tax=Acytostelium subglobosum LB1 TaxID=1410327 RepID=UPI000644B926
SRRKKDMVVVAVGTTNKAKVRATQDALDLMFPTSTTNNSNNKVLSVAVESCVRAQPMDDDETIRGATHRAKQALLLNPEAEYGIGIEGGLSNINGTWFECGWVVTFNRIYIQGQMGISSTCRFEMPERVMKGIIEEGKELADVMDELTSQSDVRSNEGAMGIFTNSLLQRHYVCMHAVVFSFSRFISKPEYWKPVVGEAKSTTTTGNN